MRFSPKSLKFHQGVQSQTKKKKNSFLKVSEKLCVIDQKPKLYKMEISTAQHIGIQKKRYTSKKYYIFPFMLTFSLLQSFLQSAACPPLETSEKTSSRLSHTGFPNLSIGNTCRNMITVFSSSAIISDYSCT